MKIGPRINFAIERLLKSALAVRLGSIAEIGNHEFITTKPTLLGRRQK